MLRLRLARRDDPGRQIDSRPLDEGEIVIGRDAGADWAIDDPDRGISRRHLVVSNRGGLVTLRDTSSNGVYLGDRQERVARDRPVPVGRGETIRFGNYLLVVEEAPREAATRAGAGRDAPFAVPDGLDDEPEAGRRPRPQPFGSALKPDPFGEDRPIGDADAWDRRPEAPAGSWDAVAPHRRPDHSELIGSDARWAEPPPPPAREAGYGFDAPFERPILEKPVVAKDAAAIPSDWMDDAAPAALPPATRAEPAIAPPPPAEPPLLAEPPFSVAPAQDVPATPADPILARPAVEAPAAPPLPRAAPADPAPAAEADAVLFDHFCAGAGLDPRHFAGEDRARVMERLGGIYRQAVLGIADLMRERTSLRNEYRMVHTTVRPEGNNPFKWVPPQRIAIELLREEGGGYTTGERALNDALHDVKAHLLCMLAGMRAALSATFAALQPAEVEARLGGKSYLMAVQRDAALWSEYVTLADALRVEADDSADGVINRAFRHGYEEQAAAVGGQWR